MAISKEKKDQLDKNTKEISDFLAKVENLQKQNLNLYDVTEYEGDLKKLREEEKTALAEVNEAVAYVKVVRESLSQVKGKIRDFIKMYGKSRITGDGTPKGKTKVYKADGKLVIEHNGDQKFEIPVNFGLQLKDQKSNVTEFLRKNGLTNGQIAGLMDHYVNAVLAKA